MNSNIIKIRVVFENYIVFLRSITSVLFPSATYCCIFGLLANSNAFVSQTVSFCEMALSSSVFSRDVSSLKISFSSTENFLFKYSTTKTVMTIVTMTRNIRILFYQGDPPDICLYFHWLLPFFVKNRLV